MCVCANELVSECVCVCANELVSVDVDMCVVVLPHLSLSDSVSTIQGLDGDCCCCPSSHIL